MIKQRMKLYNAETRMSGYDAYGQPLSTFAGTHAVEVSITLLTKVINELDPRYITATHLGLTTDKTLIEGMKLIGTTFNYMINMVNNDGRLTQLTLQEVI